MMSIHTLKESRHLPRIHNCVYQIIFQNKKDSDSLASFLLPGTTITFNVPALLRCQCLGSRVCCAEALSLSYTQPTHIYMPLNRAVCF